MPMVCIYVYVYARTLINIYGVGFGVAVCYKGNTRASECGTARLQSRFYFLYCGASILEAPLFHKYDLNSVCIGTEFYFYIFLYFTSYLCNAFGDIENTGF